jgi:hypothetical protein
MITIKDKKIKRWNHGLPGIKWPHIITDHTFDAVWLIWIKKEFNEFLRSLSKDKLGRDQLNSDGSFKPGVNIFKTPDGTREVSSFSKVLMFHPHGINRWNEIIREVIHLSPDRLLIEQLRRTYVTMVQLTVVFPNYIYGWHTDAVMKRVSGVCYIGHNESGTVVKSSSNIVTVPWEDNRALWFCGSSADREESSVPPKRRSEVYKNGNDPFEDECDPLITFHMFKNETNLPRTICNLNVITTAAAIGKIGLHDDNSRWGNHGIPFDQMYNQPKVDGMALNKWSMRVASAGR